MTKWGYDGDAGIFLSRDVLHTYNIKRNLPIVVERYGVMNNALGIGDVTLISCKMRCMVPWSEYDFVIMYLIYILLTFFKNPFHCIYIIKTLRSTRNIDFFYYIICFWESIVI